jgi:uncharacterized protein YkwD
MRSARRRAFAALGLVVLALAAPTGASATECAGADQVPADQGRGAAAQATLCLLNGERAARGLAPLLENASLTQASQAYSDRMVAERFFAHTGPDGADLVTRLTRAGYLGGALSDWAVGENLAWGEAQLATPRATVAAWMDSDGHRENILARDYEEIGLGITMGTPGTGRPGATYATDFGRRRAAVVSAAPARRAAAKRKLKARKATVRKATARKAKAREAMARKAKARKAGVRKAKAGKAVRKAKARKATAGKARLRARRARARAARAAKLRRAAAAKRRRHRTARA